MAQTHFSNEVQPAVIIYIFIQQFAVEFNFANLNRCDHVVCVTVHTILLPLRESNSHAREASNDDFSFACFIVNM